MGVLLCLETVAVSQLHPAAPPPPYPHVQHPHCLWPMIRPRVDDQTRCRDRLDDHGDGLFHHSGEAFVLRSSGCKYHWTFQPAQRALEWIHSFIHSGHFYSAPSSPLPFRGAPDYSTDTVSEFHSGAHRRLQVKDWPKAPT